MGSKKRSSWAKQKAQFAASLSDDALGGAFSREGARSGHDGARRRKACTSKKRYASRAEAEANLEWCEDNGAQGLAVYRCPYCDGWHLTSHPWD